METRAKDLNKPNKPENQNESVKVYFGIFFDGTNNHRLQVMIGKLYREKVKNKNNEPILTNEEKELINENNLFLSDNQFENLNEIYDEEIAEYDKALEIYKSEKRIDETYFELMNDRNKLLNEKSNLPNKIEAMSSEIKQMFNEEPIKSKKILNKYYQSEFDKTDRTITLLWNKKQEDVQRNNFTNIALLEPAFQAKDLLDANEKCFRIYIEGSGTDADITEGEDTAGLAFGQGRTGVVRKVKDAIFFIKKRLCDISKSKVKEIDLTFDIFGFSRGATSARILIHLLTTNDKESVRHLIQLDKIVLDERVNKIKFNFLGIYDTVSSVGVLDDGSYINRKVQNFDKSVASDTSSFDHSKNVEDLGLNSLNKVENIFHLCALDEYRVNFALVPIPTGTEIFIPGAHADVGGGYARGSNITKLQIDMDGNKIYIPEFPYPKPEKKGKTVNPIKINIENLHKLGWLSPKEVNPKEVKQEKEITFSHFSERGYSFIGLHIMSEQANKMSGRNLFKKIEKSSTPSDLTTLKEYISGKIINNERIIAVPKDEQDWGSIKSYKNLRMKYLHFSTNNMKSLRFVKINYPRIIKDEDKFIYERDEYK